MLESLRNAGKTWVAKLLLLLLAGSFGVWGIQDIFGGFRSKALVTIGSQEISADQYTTTYRQTLQQLAQQSGQALTAEDARKAGLDRSILNNLIQSAVIDAQIENLKLNISHDLIVEETQKLPAFQNSAGQFDRERFTRALQQQGMNEQMFLASEARNRSRAALTSAVDRGITVPNTLTEALYRYQNEQRDAKYFTITASDADVTQPTDDELNKQYEATPAAYTAPEYRSIAVMKVEPSDIAARISITPEDVTAGYAKYKANYFTPEKRTILQISFPSLDEAKKAKERIAAGTDFVAIAKERGATDTDITFADKTRADFLDATIADAAFKLKQDEVSEPVSGSLVTALLKATKIAPEKQATLDEIRDELTKRLQAERAVDEVQAVFEAVENARNSQTKFEEIAKEQNIPLIIVPAISATGKDPADKEVDIPDKPEVLKAAFESDVGVENEAITPRDSYFWYEVREVIPSALRPFETVKEQVKSDVIARKIRENLTDRATKLVDKLKVGGNLDALATEAKSTVKTAQDLKRNEASADFDVPAITSLYSVPENSFAWSMEGDGKAARVMQSLPVLATPFDTKSESAKKLVASLNADQSKDIMTTYLSALQNQIGVSINNTLWQQISGTAPASP
jgi:peptidyl-prolyl cis-trans isomerase D